MIKEPEVKLFNLGSFEENQGLTAPTMDQIQSITAIERVPGSDFVFHDGNSAVAQIGEYVRICFADGSHCAAVLTYRVTGSGEEDSLEYIVSDITLDFEDQADRMTIFKRELILAFLSQMSMRCENQAYQEKMEQIGLNVSVHDSSHLIDAFLSIYPPSKGRIRNLAQESADILNGVDEYAAEFFRKFSAPDISQDEGVLVLIELLRRMGHTKTAVYGFLLEDAGDIMTELSLEDLKKELAQIHELFLDGGVYNYHAFMKDLALNGIFPISGDFPLEGMKVIVAKYK